MNREDKLKKLKEQKASKGLVVLTDGQPFIDALESKIDELKKTLGAGVEVDAADLVEELKGITSFIPAIKQLIESIKKVQIQELADGLKDVNVSFDEQLGTLEKIAAIELPQIQVKVESINETNAKKVTKELENLSTTNDKIGELNKKNLNEIVKSIDELTTHVKANLVKSTSADNYTPVRRVKLVGNTLVFDDSTWSGGGSGGGGGIQPALLRNSDTTVAIVNPDGSGVDNSSVIFDNTTAVTPKFKVVSVASSGDNTVVSAVTSKKIRVLSYAFVSSGTVNVKWRSNSTDTSGLMYFIANTGISAGYNPKGHLQTAAGEALIINLSGAVPVGGHLTYIEVD